MTQHINALRYIKSFKELDLKMKWNIIERIKQCHESPGYIILSDYDSDDDYYDLDHYGYDSRLEAVKKFENELLSVIYK